MEAFLQMLKDAGYTGEPTVEAISAWLAANPDKVSVAGDWQELFKSAPAEVPAVPKSIDASTLLKVKKLEDENAALRKKAAVSAVTRPGIVTTEPAGDLRHKALRQAYKARRELGKAKFDDPEFAEIVGASCRLSLAKARDYAQRENDLAIVGKTYSTQVNTTGGYLVNESVAEAIVYMTEAFGTSRELANEVRMPEATHRARRKTAIGAMYAMSEGGSFTDVQPTYDMVNLVAKDAGAKFQYTRNFWQDAAINIADEIASSAAEAYGRRIDLDYFEGDGTSTYNGHVGLKNLVTNTGGVLTEVDGTGAWSGFTLTNFHTLMSTPINVDQSRLKFVCSRQFFHQVMLRLAYGTAKGSIEAPVAALRNSGRIGGEFMGFPVYFDQVSLPIASANGARACYFGDFEGASMIGIRADMELFESEHTSAANRMIDVFVSGRYAVNFHGHGRTSQTTGMIAALKATA